MRFTVIDSHATVSFIADCRALDPLVIACRDGPRTLTDLMAGAERFGASLADFVSSGLAVFDEHNVDSHYETIDSAIGHFPGYKLPVFRVVDDVTRQASLQPVKAGAVIFNLTAPRIVQLQNSYRDVRRMVARVGRLERAGWRILP